MSVSVDQGISAAERRWRSGWEAGPTRLCWTKLPPQVGDVAPEATLPDHAGRPVRLASLWEERPLLLLFWRHFACSCGTDRAVRLRDELDEYRAAGGNVAIVGQGEPERAARYRDLHRLDVPILCDPDRSTYQAFGLLQGTTAQILYDADDEWLRRDLQTGLDLADARHGTDRALVDDPWQLPGEFVIGPGGLIAFVHRYGWCEDFIDPRVHVAAIRMAAGRL